MAGIWDIVSGVTNRTQDLQNEMAQRDLLKAQALDTASQMDERKKQVARREELAKQFDDPILKAGIYDPTFLMGYGTLKKQTVQDAKNKLIAKIMGQQYGFDPTDMGYGSTPGASIPPQQQQAPMPGLEPNPINDVQVEPAAYDWTQDMQPNVTPEGEALQPEVTQESIPLLQPTQVASNDMNRAKMAELMGFLTGDTMKGQQVGQDIREKDPKYIENIERVKTDTKSRRTLLDTVYDDANKIIAAEPQVQVIESSLNDLVASGADTGPLANTASWVNAFGNQVGLDFGLDEGATYENIAAATSQLAAPLAKQLGVNPTDFDYKQILKSIASPDKSLAGNFALVDLQKQNIVKQKGKADLINDLEKQGASLAEVKRAITDYDKAYKVDVPKAIPTKKEQLKEGAKYFTNKGIFIWDGEKLNNVNE